MGMGHSVDFSKYPHQVLPAVMLHVSSVCVRVSSKLLSCFVVSISPVLAS